MSTDVTRLRRVVIPVVLVGFTGFAALGSWVLVRSVDDAIYTTAEWADDLEVDPGFAHVPAGTDDVGDLELRRCDDLDAGEINPMVRRTLRTADPAAAIASFTVALEAADWNDQGLADGSVAAFERAVGPADDARRTFVRVRPGAGATEVLVEAVDIDEICSATDSD